MRGSRLTADEAVMLVLAGLKGEEGIGELCRRYGVSQTTYYKLRDAFLQGGAEGIEHRGHTSEVAALKDRVRQLERTLGRKTLEVEIPKKTDEFLKRRRS